MKLGLKGPMRPLLGYGDFAYFFCSDFIATLNYVLMDNCCVCFYLECIVISQIPEGFKVWLEVVLDL